jgi:hypothetical protein
MTGTFGSRPKTASSRSIDPADVSSHILQSDLRHHLPPFTASRMTTRPPLGPGTAPRTRRMFRPSVGLDNFQIQDRHLLVAHLASHPSALKHPGRRCTLADGPRLAVGLVRSVGCAHATEIVALHDAPPHPLPLLMAVTSTRSPASRISNTNFLAHLISRDVIKT